MINLFVKSVLFTLLVPGIIAVGIPWFITSELASNEGAFYLFSTLFMSLGTAIYGWCVWDFIVKGRGTPAPIDAPKKLVTSGLYCYTRNPMYLGVFCFITGWVLLFLNWQICLYSLIILSCIHMLVIFYEEPVLLQLFGDEYLSYKTIVNRWLPIVSC